MADDDFAAQLELEEREIRMKENMAKAGTGSSGDDPYTHVDEDGTTYEWDHEKKAWFPKISEDFLAAYQANYGEPSSSTVTNTGQPQTENSEQDQDPDDQPKTADKRKLEPPGWFEVDDQHNTNVYVSNLPLDTTEEEFVELMSKCGIVMKDTDNGTLKIKLYRDNNGQLKGDGRCCYVKVESVNLALSILDGSQVRGKDIRVERAKFQLKGEYDPTKKPRKRKNRDKKKLKQIQDKLLDWRPDRIEGTRLKCEKTVIIKNMFDPKEFEEDATMILEYQNDLREECTKFGDVKKVTVFDRHPEGVASVSFKEAEMADQCVEALNGRWFAQRRLVAETWDGKSKYSIQETDQEKEDRIKQWESFLEKASDKASEGVS